MYIVCQSNLQQRQYRPQRHPGVVNTHPGVDQLPRFGRDSPTEPYQVSFNLLKTLSLFGLL